MSNQASHRLIEWFRANGRNLPWRGPFPRPPYPVLVSEIMLQQTQVDRVVVAFTQFLRHFPDLTTLATAKQADVLAQWSGLGYYRRARLLYAAAKEINQRGSWPGTVEELVTIPGLGPYTASALASFAFGQKAPPVDGNIARVASRMLALSLRLGSTRLLAEARRFALDLAGEQATAEFWEGLMELGATVCTPRSPKCDSCPLSSNCQARNRGEVDQYPLPRNNRASESITWVTLWAERPDGRVLLIRVDSGPLLKGLWLPPTGEVGPQEEPVVLARDMALEYGLGGKIMPMPSIRHAITYRNIRLLPFRMNIGNMVAEERPGIAWCDPHKANLPTSTLLKKLAYACQEGKLPPISPKKDSEKKR